LKNWRVSELSGTDNRSIRQKGTVQRESFVGWEKRVGLGGSNQIWKKRREKILLQLPKTALIFPSIGGTLGKRGLGGTQAQSRV